MGGWQSPIVRVKEVVVWGMVGLSTSTVFRKDIKPQDTPDLEFIEFLGSWET